MFEQNASNTIRIYAVIVLYKISSEDSVSLRSLQAAIRHAPKNIVVQIAVYDNSPGGCIERKTANGVEWHSYGENRGLAIPYNEAAETASNAGFEWLLTLDQDTSLPIDFIAKLGSTIQFVSPLSQVAAIAPRIYDKDRLISPNGLLWNMLPTFLPEDFTGVSLQGATSAINSASTVRISALQSVGGYDERFPLDYCDAVMYHRLRRGKFRIFVAGQIRVQHELSVLDMANRINPNRYQMILGAESAFWDECMGMAANVALPLRYLYRIVYKLWRTGGNFWYARVNLRFLCRRLFRSRNHRARVWEEQMRNAFGGRK